MSIAATVGRPIVTGLESCIHDGFVSFERLEGVDRDFLFYVLKERESAWGAAGQTGSQSNVNTGIVAGVEVRIPADLAEQKRIARTLSDVDDLIDSLDRLIEKKRGIKTAASQALMAGRRRLTGFEEDWLEMTLGDVVTVRHGRDQKPVLKPEGLYPILASGGEIGRTDTAIHPGPSVLIGRKGTIDKPQFQRGPFWTIDTLFYTEVSPGFDPRFVYYLFWTIPWRAHNEGSGVPSLSASRIESIDVRLPSQSEQEAIAEVLSDMDDEIEALGARREKTTMVKKAMMHELLTRKSRLV